MPSNLRIFLFALALGGVFATGPSTVTCTYEDIDASGLSGTGVTGGTIPNPYCGLTHDKFGLGVISLLGTQPVKPIDKQFAGGISDAQLIVNATKAEYPYRTSKAESTYMACFINTYQGQSPGENCKVKVSGFNERKQLVSENTCEYSGGATGTVQKCNFQEIASAAYWSFQLLEPNQSEIVELLTKLTGGIGELSIAIDDWVHAPDYER